MSQSTDLAERVAKLERIGISRDEDLRNCVSKLLEIEKLVHEHDGDIKPERERRAKWKEDRRFVMRHLVTWSVPALIGWLLLIFSGGFRSWVRTWLGA